jgi:hypothetical protein
VFLVSDAMPPAASLGTTFALNGRTVTKRDGKLTLEDRTAAGPVLTMDQAVKYAVDQPLTEALRMASLYPAQFLRLDRDRGRIAPPASSPTWCCWVRTCRSGECGSPESAANLDIAIASRLEVTMRAFRDHRH